MEQPLDTVKQFLIGTMWGHGSQEYLLSWKYKQHKAQIWKKDRERQTAHKFSLNKTIFWPNSHPVDKLWLRNLNQKDAFTLQTSCMNL